MITSLVVKPDVKVVSDFLVVTAISHSGKILNTAQKLIRYTHILQRIIFRVLFHVVFD